MKTRGNSRRAGIKLQAITKILQMAGEIIKTFRSLYSYWEGIKEKMKEAIFEIPVR